MYHNIYQKPLYSYYLSLHGFVCDMHVVSSTKNSDYSGQHKESRLTMSVQTSYNIELPPHLLLTSSMIELRDCIGQGMAIAIALYMKYCPCLYCALIIQLINTVP